MAMENTAYDNGIRSIGKQAFLKKKLFHVDTIKTFHQHVPECWCSALFSNCVDIQSSGVFNSEVTIVNMDDGMSSDASHSDAY